MSFVPQPSAVGSARGEQVRDEQARLGKLMTDRDLIDRGDDGVSEPKRRPSLIGRIRGLLGRGESS